MAKEEVENLKMNNDLIIKLTANLET